MKNLKNYTNVPFNILAKCKKSIKSYDEFDDMTLKSDEYNKLRMLSIKMLSSTNNKELNDELIESINLLRKDELPFETCLIVSRYLNSVSDEEIKLISNFKNFFLNINSFNDDILNILYSKIHFSLPPYVLINYVFNSKVNDEYKYKIRLLMNKFENLREVKIKYENDDFNYKLLGLKIKNISKIEVIYHNPKIRNFLYIVNEDTEIINLENGEKISEYNYDSKLDTSDNQYQRLLNILKNKDEIPTLYNRYERMVFYETINMIYLKQIKIDDYFKDKKIVKKIINLILDNQNLFKKNYIEIVNKIIKINSKTYEYVNRITKNPTNEELHSIIEDSENIDEIFSVLKQSEKILEYKINSDIYLTAILKCYNILKNDNSNIKGKLNIAIFCEELISKKPLIFTEVIKILKEMYKDKVFTNETLNTLRYIKHTVKDDDFIDDLVFYIKSENYDFDSEFINKIKVFNLSKSKNKLKLADEMVNKLIYNEKDINKYNDELCLQIYKFFQRNRDLNALDKLCRYAYENNKNIFSYNVNDNNIISLLKFYNKNNIQIDDKFYLKLINEYKTNYKILDYAKERIKLIYLKPEKKEYCNLLNEQYKELSKIFNKKYDKIFQLYLQYLESNNETFIYKDELEYLDLSDIKKIQEIIKRLTVNNSSKVYMLRVLINYYAKHLDKKNIIEYINLYINKYNSVDDGGLFKDLLNSQSENISFIEIVLQNIDFKSIQNADLFMSILADKLVNNKRIDLLKDVLHYYISNKKYMESIKTLRQYINTDNYSELDEPHYLRFVIPILDNISVTFQKEIYDILIYRKDLPIEIREKYFSLNESEYNKQIIIQAFKNKQTQSMLAKQLALNMYYDKDDEFLKVSRLGSENNYTIFNIIYKKCLENFKDNKDYLRELLQKNTYNEEYRINQIKYYLEKHNENIFDINNQIIFGEYEAIKRQKGEYVDKLVLKNIFTKAEITAILFHNHEIRDKTIDYLDKIKSKYNSIIGKQDVLHKKDVIYINENKNLKFLEEGNIMLFIENLKLLLKLQKNLILNGCIIVEFSEDSFIINKKGFIPNQLENMYKYYEEFKIKRKPDFKNIDNIYEGDYIVVNEKNICKIIKLYTKNILLETIIVDKALDIKENFIKKILENDSIISYDSFLEQLELFIEKENNSFKYMNYKEKIESFDKLEENEKIQVVDEILYKEDTSWIAKKVVLRIKEYKSNISSYVMYLINCINNYTSGFLEKDYLEIYNKVNDNINSIDKLLIEENKNDIFNFYIEMKNLCNIHSNDIKDDIDKLSLSDDDKDYLKSRI